ncbi:hypothetical protein [Halomonas sp.]|uniref:hypothetical protein n=1 Tax=Halomonas sp. TaxID=1486246 RepID=UPI00298DA8DB|nr:hypothetical protein [Halomonas sp.]MDW7748251.1 hypothetical protein [Halomonas sp.]
MNQQSSPAPEDPLDRIFAYRAFDLRDRFPQPLETFREALECLQSESAYLPSWSGEIVAYLRGGGSISIPDRFFFRDEPGVDPAIVSPEFNDEVCAEVQEWLRQELQSPRGFEDS